MSLPTFSTLNVSLQDRVCWVEFNRPKRKNALDTTMYEEVISAFKWAASEDAVHVLVLTGSPLSTPLQFYSSGNDLRNFTAALESGDADPVKMAAGSCDLVVRFVDQFILFPKPLIAAVNGPAHGIAVTTCLLADLIYTNTQATFTTPFTKLGQNPEGCSSVLFPERMGAKANTMLLMGETVNAIDAERWNMTTAIFPDATFRADVQARAKKLAAFPIHSVMASKQLVRRQSQAALMAANRDEAKVLEQLLLDPRTFEAVLQQINSMAAPKSKL